MVLLAMMLIAMVLIAMMLIAMMLIAMMIFNKVISHCCFNVRGKCAEARDVQPALKNVTIGMHW